MEKYYAVRKGRKPGIYDNWDECKDQVHSFKGAIYKSFEYYEDAVDFVGIQPTNELSEIPSYGIAVDGSCLGNGKTDAISEYRGVDIETGDILFTSGALKGGTNNVAEFLALCEAMKYVWEENLSISIYSDSQTAMAWVNNKEMNSNLGNISLELQEKINNACEFLKDSNLDDFDIIKWDTGILGEIPADFGRK